MSTIHIAALLAAILIAAPHHARAPLVGPTPPPADSPGDAYEALDNVLSDPDLQRPATAPPQDEPFQLPDVAVPQIGGDLARFALILAGGIGVVLLIVLLGPALLRYLAARKPPRDRPARNASDDAETSSEAVVRARQASAAQDYRLAVRMLYLAALLKLDEAGALHYDRAQTNREYLRQIADRPALAGPLRPVVETFDDVWYGYRPVTPESYGQFESHVTSVLQAAQSQPPPQSQP